MGFFRNTSRAEDVVSDVFERICKNIQQFRDLDCNKTRMLIVIYSKNICRNALKRDKIIAFDALEEDFTPAEDDTAALMLDKDSFERIVEMINSMKDTYADVCRLKLVLQMQDSEIANALDISEGNVRVRYNRGRSILRRELLKEAEQYDKI